MGGESEAITAQAEADPLMGRLYCLPDEPASWELCAFLDNLMRKEDHGDGRVDNGVHQ